MCTDRSQNTTCMKAYSVYSAIKLLAVASVLLGYAVARHKEVDRFYGSTEICDSCLASSKVDPTHLYEFGRCGTNWRVPDKADNLMRVGGFWDNGVGSSVWNYVPVAAVLFVLIVFIASCMPIVSFGFFGCNFDHGPFHTRQAAADAAIERESLVTPRGGSARAAGGADASGSRERKQSGNNNNNNNGNNEQLGDAQLAHDIERAGGDPVAAGVSGAPARGAAGRMHQPSGRLDYGFGETTHNDQCVFLQYELGLLTGLFILIMSQQLGELYLQPQQQAGSVGACYVSAYNMNMDLAFDILVIIAFVFLMLEAFVNLCAPKNRFVFNVASGLAIVAIMILSLVMAFRNIAGPAGNVLTFVTTLVGFFHIIEVPLVLLRHVSHRSPVDVMHL